MAPRCSRKNLATQRDEGRAIIKAIVIVRPVHSAANYQKTENDKKTEDRGRAEASGCIVLRGWGDATETSDCDTSNKSNSCGGSFGDMRQDHAANWVTTREGN